MEEIKEKYSSGYGVVAKSWCYGERTERGTIFNVIDWVATSEEAEQKANELNNKEK